MIFNLSIESVFSLKKPQLSFSNRHTEIYFFQMPTKKNEHEQENLKGLFLEGKKYASWS